METKRQFLVAHYISSSKDNLRSHGVRGGHYEVKLANFILRQKWCFCYLDCLTNILPFRWPKTLWPSTFAPFLRLELALPCLVHAICFSLTNTYLYRAFPATISTMALLASLIGTLLFHVRTPFSAKNSNICLISRGVPIKLPVRLQRLKIRANTAISVSALATGRIYLGGRP
jgi:hypothetical protein